MTKQTVLKLQTIERSPDPVHKAVLFGALDLLSGHCQGQSYGQ